MTKELADHTIFLNLFAVEVTIFVQAFSDGNPVFTVGGWSPSNPVIKLNVPEEEPIGKLDFFT